jgi:hypothetical protein
MEARLEPQAARPVKYLRFQVCFSQEASAAPVESLQQARHALELQDFERPHSVVPRHGAISLARGTQPAEVPLHEFVHVGKRGHGHNIRDLSGRGSLRAQVEGQKALQQIAEMIHQLHRNSFERDGAVAIVPSSDWVS